MKTVGLVGVGLLGTAIAERLLAAGYGVMGFDLNSDRLRELETFGGAPAVTPAHVFEQCQTVFISLPDSSIAGRVLCDFDWQSSHGRRLVIDTTTGSPEDARNLAEVLAKHNVTYLDATIAGSSDQVRHGEAVAMVGGDRAGFNEAVEYLRTFTREQFHTGPSGSGSTVKLIVNLVLGLNRLVLAEGLSLARTCGLDAESVLAILKSGPAYSRAMDTKGQKMIEGAFDPPQARLDQHWKDVRLILELGAQHGISLPLSTLHESLLSQVSARGLGQLDNSVIIRAFDTMKREM